MGLSLVSLHEMYVTRPWPWDIVGLLQGSKRPPFRKLGEKSLKRGSGHPRSPGLKKLKKESKTTEAKIDTPIQTPGRLFGVYVFSFFPLENKPFWYTPNLFAC